MKRGYDYAQKNSVVPLKKFVGQAAQKAPRRSNAITPIQLVLVAILSLIIGIAATLTMVPPDLVRKIQHKEAFF
jgi:hypothetical protein